MAANPKNLPQLGEAPPTHGGGHDDNPNPDDYVDADKFWPYVVPDFKELSPQMQAFIKTNLQALAQAARDWSKQHHDDKQGEEARHEGQHFGVLAEGHSFKITGADEWSAIAGDSHEFIAGSLEESIGGSWTVRHGARLYVERTPPPLAPGPAATTPAPPPDATTPAPPPDATPPGAKPEPKPVVSAFELPRTIDESVFGTESSRLFGHAIEHIEGRRIGIVGRVAARQALSDDRKKKLDDLIADYETTTKDEQERIATAKQAWEKADERARGAERLKAADAEPLRKEAQRQQDAWLAARDRCTQTLVQKTQLEYMREQLTIAKQDALADVVSSELVLGSEQTIVEGNSVEWVKGTELAYVGRSDDEALKDGVNPTIIADHVTYGSEAGIVYGNVFEHVKGREFRAVGKAVLPIKDSQLVVGTTPAWAKAAGPSAGDKRWKDAKTWGGRALSVATISPIGFVTALTSNLVGELVKPDKEEVVSTEMIGGSTTSTVTGNESSTVLGKREEMTMKGGSAMTIGIVDEMTIGMHSDTKIGMAGDTVLGLSSPMELISMPSAVIEMGSKLVSMDSATIEIKTESMYIFTMGSGKTKAQGGADKAAANLDKAKTAANAATEAETAAKAAKAEKVASAAAKVEEAAATVEKATTAVERTTQVASETAAAAKAAQELAEAAELANDASRARKVASAAAAARKAEEAAKDLKSAEQALEKARKAEEAARKIAAAAENAKAVEKAAEKTAKTAQALADAKKAADAAAKLVEETAAAAKLVEQMEKLDKVGKVNKYIEMVLSLSLPGKVLKALNAGDRAKLAFKIGMLVVKNGWAVAKAGVAGKDATNKADAARDKANSDDSTPVAPQSLDLTPAQLDQLVDEMMGEFPPGTSREEVKQAFKQL